MKSIDKTAASKQYAATQEEKTMNREAEIRGIAYQLWEKEGRPQGRDVEFWQKAEAIWQEGLVQQATPPKPKATSQEAETAKVRARPKRARR